MGLETVVVYGGLGSGKSTYALKIIDPEKTIKLGVGGPLKDIVTLKWGSTGRHETENQNKGVPYKTTRFSSIIKDISEIERPAVLIDEWTSFFSHSWHLPSREIVEKVEEIFDAIRSNSSIQRAVCVALDYIPYIPFNIYKKKALWNKLLFENADRVIKIDYGRPYEVPFSKE